MTSPPVVARKTRASYSKVVARSGQRIGRRDGCVIWNRIPFETPVIPAKAGIYCASHFKCVDVDLDSRFRGNDCTWERPWPSNDTSTDARAMRELRMNPRE